MQTINKEGLWHITSAKMHLSVTRGRRLSFSLKSVPSYSRALQLNRTISVKRFLLTFSNFHLGRKYWQKRRSLDLTWFDWLREEHVCLIKIIKKNPTMRLLNVRLCIHHIRDYCEINVPFFTNFFGSTQIVLYADLSLSVSPVWKNTLLSFVAFTYVPLRYLSPFIS